MTAMSPQTKSVPPWAHRVTEGVDGTVDARLVPDMPRKFEFVTEKSQRCEAKGIRSGVRCRRPATQCEVHSYEARTIHRDNSVTLVCIPCGHLHKTINVNVEEDEDPRIARARLHTVEGRGAVNLRDVIQDLLDVIDRREPRDG